MARPGCFALLSMLCACAAGPRPSPPAAEMPAAEMATAAEPAPTPAPVPASAVARPDAVPSPPAPRPPEPPPPTVVRFAEHELVLSHDSRGFVATIAQGPLQIYPPDCDAPGRRVGLCSAAHRRLRSSDGKGQDLYLVESSASDSDVRLVFAAMFFGSPECGRYGYWILRLDRRGRVHIGDPATGCFGGEQSVEIRTTPFRVRVRPYLWTSPTPPRWVTVPWR